MRQEQGKHPVPVRRVKEGQLTEAAKIQNSNWNIKGRQARKLHPQIKNVSDIPCPTLEFCAINCNEHNSPLQNRGTKIAVNGHTLRTAKQPLQFQYYPFKKKKKQKKQQRFISDLLPPTTLQAGPSPPPYTSMNCPHVSQHATQGTYRLPLYTVASNTSIDRMCNHIVLRG